MTIWEWIEKGGALMQVLVLMSVVGWSVIIWKGAQIWSFFKNTQNHLQNLKNKISSFDFSKNKIEEQQQLEYVLSYYMDNFYKGLSTIKIIATVSPLIGLLGTVWGILSSFQTIAVKGLSDPSLFAEGISLALITTVGGLLVAIPHFISYNYFSGALEKAERLLEQQYFSKE